MSDWSQVAEAVKAETRAYAAMVTSREEDSRYPSKVRAAEEAWEEAWTARRAALFEAWDEELDGFRSGGAKSIAHVLRRYYRETYVRKEVKR